MEVVGHPGLDTNTKPPVTISIPLPMSSVPVISENPDNEEISVKRRRVEGDHKAQRGDHAKDVKEERESDIANLSHDHSYSYSDPFAESRQPCKNHPGLLHELGDNRASLEHNEFMSKDCSYDEDDLTCKELMETEEEMDKRNLQWNPVNSDVTVTINYKKKSSELKLNDNASLLKAIDDDIEKLKQEEIDYSDLDENACDNDDEFNFFPLNVKKECLD